MTYNLILLRHGESEWNQKNLFTGWVDVTLTDKGRAEGARAGELLREKERSPDVVYTSRLKRAILTANSALEAADLSWRDGHRSSPLAHARAPQPHAPAPPCARRRAPPTSPTPPGPSVRSSPRTSRWRPPICPGSTSIAAGASTNATTAPCRGRTRRRSGRSSAKSSS